MRSLARRQAEIDNTRTVSFTVGNGEIEDVATVDGDLAGSAPQRVRPQLLWLALAALAGIVIDREARVRNVRGTVEIIVPAATRAVGEYFAYKREQERRKREEAERAAEEAAKEEARREEESRGRR